MIVLKFGGTSVQDAAALDRVGDIVAMRRGEKALACGRAPGLHNTPNLTFSLLL